MEVQQGIDTGAAIGSDVPGGIAGYVLFVNPTGILAQDPQFLFTDVTNTPMLQIGTTAGAPTLPVLRLQSSSTTWNIRIATASSHQLEFFNSSQAAASIRFGVDATASTLVTNVSGVGIYAAPLDPLSFSVNALAASATRAMINLSNTVLSSGSSSGTYIGSNPASFAGNFIDFQVANTSKFSIRASDGTATTTGEFRPGNIAYTGTGVRGGSTATAMAFGYAGNATGYSAEIDVYGITHATPGLIEFRTGTASAQQAVVMTLSAVGNLGIGLVPAATNRLDVLDTTLAGSGSLAGSVVNIAQTWNTTGAPTAFKLNVTNTASNTTLGVSRLFDFQVGGTSKFFFDVNAGAFYYATGLIRTTNNYDLFNDNNAGLLSIYSTNTSGVGVVNINITSGIRATVKIADNVSYVTNAVSTCNFAGLQVSPTCNPGASNSGGNFYGARINPIFTTTTGLTGAYIFVASASSVDKFQITSTGLVNCLIDGNSLQVGSGSNTAVYAGFAAQRGFFGYDGTSMLSQGGSGKALQFSVNSNTFGSGTVKLSLASGATAVGIGGAITNSATLAGAVLVVNDTSITSSVLLTNYNAINTAGWGVPAIYGRGRSVAQTAAVASVATYTVGASDGSFEISMNLLVTASTLFSFTCECAYTDEGNTARVVTLSFCNLAGAFVTAIANAAGAVPYEGVPLHIRCKASTAITLRTQAAGTYTTVTYNVEGNIIQTA